MCGAKRGPTERESEPFSSMKMGPVPVKRVDAVCAGFRARPAFRTRKIPEMMNEVCKVHSHQGALDSGLGRGFRL